MNGPCAQLPAPDLSTASKDQGDTASAGDRTTIFSPEGPSPHLRDEVRCPAIHRPVAGGVDDDVGREFLAVRQQDAGFGEAHRVYTGFELDIAVGHQFGGTYIDVVAGYPAADIS